MIYVCVICMVSPKLTLLKTLGDKQRQIWERILSARINKKKLQKCLLLICTECNQLLDTILEFRSTMNIGAKHLLKLYYNDDTDTVVTEKPESFDLPALPLIIRSESDLLLPVANEEIVQSTESWDAIEPARPLPTKIKVIKLPRILSCSRPVTNVSSRVHAPDYNEDYAVLIPVNEKTPDLVYKEDVVHSSEISETSKIEDAMPMPKDVKEDIDTEVFSNVNESNETKIKLNQQLFEAIRATLQSPSLKKEFDIKYEPESGSESGCKSDLELRRESRPELGRESTPELGRASGIELGRESGPELRRESKPEMGRESKPGLRRESGLELARESAPELGRVSKPEMGRESKPRLGRESGLELGQESGPEVKRESGPELGCESEPDLGHESEPDLGHESEPDLGHESEPDLVHESERDSESTLSCQSDYEDPENFPNIIFARAFNEISGKESPQIIGNGLEGEGKPKDVQIHSHLVTNPPSEWPCTWENCELQSLGEEEVLKSKTDTPRTKQVTRPKRKNARRGSKCKICGKSFVKISTLWIHYEREHMEPSAKCSLCRKECRNERALKFHMIKDHIKSTAAFQESAALRNTCAECGVWTQRPAALRLHLLTKRHAAVALWRFQCDICKRKFPDKERMAEHIQGEHIAKEAVKCPMCTATFKSARSLGRHATAHIVAQAQENMHTNTQANGQARKRSRTTHTNAENESTNGCEDTNREEQETQTKGTRKTRRTRKMTHTKAKTYNKRHNTHTDINKQDKEKQTNGQRKGPRNSTDKNSQIKISTNIQDHTYTYINGQESTHNGQTRNANITHTNTHADRQTNGQTNTESHKITRNTNTHADIQTNTESHKITRNTNGRARKKRRRRPYTIRKRAGARAPAPSGQAPAVAKISLFDMLSSFIL